MDFPTGTVTFLFTDIEGSTRLANALGARRYGEVLDTHRLLLHGVFQEAGGIEVDRQGDSFFVVFASASAAVRAAASAQLRFGSHDWPADASVRVRIGIHTGEAVVGDDGYRGFSVHRAARICAAAHGGQILMSGTTRDVVEADLPSDLHVRDLGPSQLPGIDRPEPLFQLVVAGLPDAFPSPRAETVLRLVADTVDLLEREVELAALDALIAAVPAGGRVIVVEGPAGIGKTRLLAETRRRAASAGLQVLAARGSELELEFSYGAVRQLFEPLLAAATPGRARASSSPARLRWHAPIFDPASLLAEPDAQSSLAMLHGLFWVTANLAERQPTAPRDRRPALVRSIFTPLARLRAAASRGAVRSSSSSGFGPPSPEQTRPARADHDRSTCDRAQARCSQRGGHGPVDDRRRSSSDVDAAFRVAFHEASGGNPLLVRELANAVAAEGFASDGRQRSPAAGAGWHGVSRAVSLRLARLPAGDDEPRACSRRLRRRRRSSSGRCARRLAEATAADAAADLAGIEILRRGTPLAFVHPVVRSAVYSELSAVDRDRGHAQAARLLAEASAEPERVAAQLLLAPPAGDTWAVDVLRTAARSALARGAPDSAVPYLRRAAEAPGDAEADVLHELGLAEARVSAPAVIEHLVAARAATGDARQRARIALDLGTALFSTGGSPNDAVEVLEEAIEELAGNDPELAQQLENQLIGIARFEPGLYPLAKERLDRLRTRAPELVVGDRVLLANLASETARAGTGRSEAVDLAERALTGDTLLKEHFDPAFVYAVLTLVCAEHLDDADRLLGEALDDAQERGLVSHFFIVSCYRSLVALHRGSLADALADAEVALGVIDLHGLEFGRVYAVGLVVPALIEQGDFSRSRQLIHSAMPGEEITSYGQSLFFEARAQLLLASGEHARALRVCTAHGAFLEAFGVWNPAISAWRSQAALALLGLGRRDEAQGYAQRELSLARLWEAPRALGRSLVVAGVAEGGDDGIALLREAVAVLELSQARLEHARALVELGSALRRTNRRSDAREPLRRGLELAAVCGAVPLADRAETELRATGARPRRIALSGVGSLTPSERRVAELAAEGSTNRQIAQDLFVTTKTVEVHLSSVYRKLDIASRTQLAAALADAPAAENQAGES